MSARNGAQGSPLEVWTALAPLLAARRSMRVWRGSPAGYDQARRLATATVPTLPAALPLFDKRRRTSVLALDFDAGDLGAERVHADAAAAVALLTSADARTIVDHSPTGGRHVWVPLWTGADLTVEDLRPLLEAMARRWPTLDITPMTNPATGCLTGPGSPCVGGGHRQLLTPLADAVAAATTRSPVGTVGRIAAALGVTPLHTGARPHTLAPTALSTPGITNHRSENAAPGPRPPRRELPSPHARAFAEHGIIPSHRPSWTRSHARLSVLSWAARCGFSISDVEQRISNGQWAGMRDSYAKYGARYSSRLDSEWTKAQTWSQPVLSHVQVSPHQTTHTGGAYVWRKLLAQARRWVRQCAALDGQARGSAAAVIQALVFAAAQSGTTRVGRGGRWLSIAAGMLSERTVWQTLRTLRELEGSPVRRVRQHAGADADVYELVRPTIDGHEVQVTEDDVVSVRVEPVAPVWKVIGHAAREVFEAIERMAAAQPDGRVRTRDLIDAVCSSRSAVYDAIRTLLDAELCVAGRGWVMRTDVTLTDVAEARGVKVMVAARVERHRSERRAWWDLLALWAGEVTSECPESELLAEDPLTAEEQQRWLEIVMATGPPEHDGDPDVSPGCGDVVDGQDVVEKAITIVVSRLGGVLLPAAPR